MKHLPHLFIRIEKKAVKIKLLPAKMDFIVKNTNSETRDLLMAERTTLSWVKFSSTLLLTSVAILLNFRFSSDSKNDDDTGSPIASDKISFAFSIILSVISILSVVQAGFNYWSSIYSFGSGKIELYDSNTTLLMLMGIIFALLAINITLIIVE